MCCLGRLSPPPVDSLPIDRLVGAVDLVAAAMGYVGLVGLPGGVGWLAGMGVALKYDRYANTAFGRLSAASPTRIVQLGCSLALNSLRVGSAALLSRTIFGLVSYPVSIARMTARPLLFCVSQLIALIMRRIVVVDVRSGVPPSLIPHSSRRNFIASVPMRPRVDTAKTTNLLFGFLSIERSKMRW